MNIQAIRDTIEDLENGDTTVDTVEKLAALYIVNENYSKDLSPVIKEIDDVLPAYIEYVNVKTKYQTGNCSESLVLTYIESVCQEIKDLVATLYSGTDMRKERRCIENLIKELNTKYVEGSVK